MGVCTGTIKGEKREGMHVNAQYTHDAHVARGACHAVGNGRDRTHNSDPATVAEPNHRPSSCGKRAGH